MDFNASRELWNPLSEAVSGKFDGSSWHSKHNSFQDWANFHRCRARQIVLISNTANVFTWIPLLQIKHGLIIKDKFITNGQKKKETIPTAYA